MSPIGNSEFEPTIEQGVLLPPARVVRRPRRTGFAVYQNQPIELDLTVFQDLFTRVRACVSQGEVTVQARVFRDFQDADSLISTKTVGEGLALEAQNGQFSLLLTKTDVELAEPIYVAIYIGGALIDLFQVVIRQSPLR